MGSSFSILWPSVLMIFHPPKIVPKPMASAQMRTTHVGTSSVVITPAANERHRDDAHGLLRVVRAVAEGHEGRGHDLEPAEVPADDSGRKVTEEIEDQFHEHVAEDDAEDRRDQERGEDLHDAGDVQDAHSAVSHGSSRDAAEERVRGADRQTHEDGDKVPEDGREQGRDDDRIGDGRRVEQCPCRPSWRLPW